MIFEQFRRRNRECHIFALRGFQSFSGKLFDDFPIGIGEGEGDGVVASGSLIGNVGNLKFRRFSGEHSPAVAENHIGNGKVIAGKCSELFAPDFFGEMPGHPQRAPSGVDHRAVTGVFVFLIPFRQKADVRTESGNKFQFFSQGGNSFRIPGTVPAVLIFQPLDQAVGEKFVFEFRFRKYFMQNGDHHLEAECIVYPVVGEKMR